MSCLISFKRVWDHLRPASNQKVKTTTLINGLHKSSKILRNWCSKNTRSNKIKWFKRSSWNMLDASKRSFRTKDSLDRQARLHKWLEHMLWVKVAHRPPRISTATKISNLKSSSFNLTSKTSRSRIQTSCWIRRRSILWNRTIANLSRWFAWRAIPTKIRTTRCRTCAIIVSRTSSMTMRSQKTIIRCRQMWLRIINLSTN